MGKFGLKSMIPVGVSLLTFATLVGSISGSLAWWAYSTRVSISYQGTSVSTSEQLQIGLKLDEAIFGDAEIASLGLIKDPNLTSTELDEQNNPHTYCYAFAASNSGLPSYTISQYLTLEGKYSVYELNPITSNRYNNNEDLYLYQNLLSGYATNTEKASYDKYVFIPFVFRIAKLNSEDPADQYVGGEKIYLSNVFAQTTSVGASTDFVENAMRIHFNDGTQKFILHYGDHSYNKSMNESERAAAIAKMYTPVAGVLDLNNDGYYDSNSGKEILYGDCTVNSENTFIQNGVPTRMTDINGVYDELEDGSPEKEAILTNPYYASTFLSKHHDGMTCYSDYEGIDIGKAQYKTLEMVKPDESHGYLTDGVPVCVTNNTEGNLFYGVGSLDVTIWLEGWDHEIIDRSLETDYVFNLSLQFEIDLFN